MIEPSTLAGCRQVVSWVANATGSLNILWPVSTYGQIRMIRSTLATFLEDRGYGYKWRGQDWVEVVNGEAVHGVKFIVVRDDPKSDLQLLSRSYDPAYIIMVSLKENV